MKLPASIVHRLTSGRPGRIGERRCVLTSIRTIAFAALVAATLAQAQAQPLTRCQCAQDKWVGKCRAKLQQSGNWITITSNTPECSRVQWYAGETPQTTIVTDGVERTEWLGAKGARLAIESCFICTDAERPRKPFVYVPQPQQQESIPSPLQGMPSGWYVEAGSSFNLSDAHALRKRLAAKGINANTYVRSRGGSAIYRVRVGPFGSQPDAESANARLARNGFEGAVVQVN